MKYNDKTCFEGRFAIFLGDSKLGGKCLAELWHLKTNCVHWVEKFTEMAKYVKTSVNKMRPLNVCFVDSVAREQFLLEKLNRNLQKSADFFTKLKYFR